MNLSGEAVRYWKNKENIELENILVVVDDIALPFGTIRLRGKGADGGHNGLKSINNLLQTQNYARLRFGVGSDFPPGGQVDYVLGYPSAEEKAVLAQRAPVAVDAIKAFCLSGLAFAMNHYNTSATTAEQKPKDEDQPAHKPSLQQLTAQATDNPGENTPPEEPVSFIQRLINKYKK